MIILRVVGGVVKTLMILGLVEFIAPGLSYEGTKALINLAFRE